LIIGQPWQMRTMVPLLVSDDDFKLKAHVLSCMKHENGSSAREMEQQLTKDLRAWDLEKSFYVCSVTDTASNMNLFGEYLDGWEMLLF
jgi:hypothetical protein